MPHHDYSSLKFHFPLHVWSCQWYGPLIVTWRKPASTDTFKLPQAAHRETTAWTSYTPPTNTHGTGCLSIGLRPHHTDHGAPKTLCLPLHTGPPPDGNNHPLPSWQAATRATKSKAVPRFCVYVLRRAINQKKKSKVVHNEPPCGLAVIERPLGALGNGRHERPCDNWASDG